MPNIIQERTQSRETTSGSKYQENDYLTAARTGYFNQSSKVGEINLFTEGGVSIPKEAILSIPNLDPTLVKAITIQESNAGTTGVSDVMQSNVKGDWSDVKSNYGIKKGESTSVSNSLYAGIRILASKGFKGGVTYDKKTGKSTFTFKGWESAVKAYNGGGTKDYDKNVRTMINNSKKPTKNDY
jgi:soluble lytic murein transglycosylase-like protein